MKNLLKVKFSSNAETLQKIIAAYTPFTYSQIDLDKTIKDTYIAAEFKFNFCDDILKVWTAVDATALRNDMFGKLKTGNDILGILKYIL